MADPALEVALPSHGAFAPGGRLQPLPGMEDDPERYLPDDEAAENGEHGEVFTRRWVVDLILDLAGYKPERDLGALTALEPACGSGAFLGPMVERLAASCVRHGRDLATTTNAIVACDLLSANVAASRKLVAATLEGAGLGTEEASALSSSWVQRRDFLLSPPLTPVDFVLGNPPYIRLEMVPQERSDAYRRACTTMGGRADVYVGFYELGLHALRPGGTLGFICADRWMRNAYGAKLRELVGSGWSVDAIVSMTGVDAFEDEVDAYPAITVIRRAPQADGPLVVEGHVDLGPEGARDISALAARDEEHANGSGYIAARLHGWFSGKAGWPHGSPDRLSIIADLEANYPALENVETGTRVGIGVATGADRVFIVRDDSIAERERMLPLATPRDIASGNVEWSGKYLVNPWTDDGLVDLADWPRFAEYLGAHEELLRKRHTAKRGTWHRTIDRVAPGLAAREKLYLPDFKDVCFPVLDRGETYPHHNLYWITSDRWDLRVLGGLLMGDVANMFIHAYSVRMRGGFYRFQAQYLRRIRLPRVDDVDETSAALLAAAFDQRDRAAATRAALPLYGLARVPE